MKARSPLALVLAGLCGCARRGEPDPARIVVLQAAYAQLHQRLQTAAAKEPLLASGFPGKAEVAIAIRSSLIEELARTVAGRYLEDVTVDLRDVVAEKTGEVRKRTFVGPVKVGQWQMELHIDTLAGRLRAGTPRVRLRGPARIDVEVPVDVQRTDGEATLHFSWDATGLAGLVCRDFDVTRAIKGSVLAQRYWLSGALRLSNTGEALTASPEFPERSVRLKVDLTPKSWDEILGALREQDVFGRCGMLLDPDKGMERLRRLAARGVKVHLPDSIFRAVTLPAHLRKSVQVNHRDVELKVAARSLGVEGTTLLAGASVDLASAGRQPPPVLE